MGCCSDDPRHLWNTDKRMSSFVLYSLTGHCAHHAQGDLPFWELKAYPDAPEMPHGFSSPCSVRRWGAALLPRYCCVGMLNRRRWPSVRSFVPGMLSATFRSCVAVAAG